MLREINVGGLRLFGYSLAGEETVIAAPELNVVFDAGRAPRDVISIDNMLLTHGHMDHAAGIAYYLSQRDFIGTAPGTIVCPAEIAPAITELMRVWGRIEGHVPPGNIVGLQPGDEYELRRGLFARTFETNHRAPSLGFSIVDVRLKLKPKFTEKSGPELVALKKQGVQIQYALEVPLVCYCGDTAEGKFLDLDIVRKAKVIIIECTFYDPDHMRRAKLGAHLHVRDVARILPTLECENIVINHVTRRTGLKYARTAMASMVDPEVMSRVTFLMEGRRMRSGPLPEVVKDREDGRA